MDHMCIVRFCFNEVENEDEICESCQRNPSLTTICSSMHCYNKAIISNDPMHPAFCEPCKARTRARIKI